MENAPLTLQQGTGNPDFTATGLVSRYLNALIEPAYDEAGFSPQIFRYMPSMWQLAYSGTAGQFIATGESEYYEPVTVGAVQFRASSPFYALTLSFPIASSVVGRIYSRILSDALQGFGYAFEQNVMPSIVQWYSGGPIAATTRRRAKGRIRSIKVPPARLALTDEEWAAALSSLED